MDRSMETGMKKAQELSSTIGYIVFGFSSVVVFDYFDYVGVIFYMILMLSLEFLVQKLEDKK